MKSNFPQSDANIKNLIKRHFDFRKERWKMLVYFSQFRVTPPFFLDPFLKKGHCLKSRNLLKNNYSLLFSKGKTLIIWILIQKCIKFCQRSVVWEINGMTPSPCSLTSNSRLLSKLSFSNSNTMRIVYFWKQTGFLNFISTRLFRFKIKTNSLNNQR